MDMELPCTDGLEMGVFGECSCQAVHWLTEHVESKVFQNQMSNAGVIPQAGCTSVPEAWRQ